MANPLTKGSMGLSKLSKFHLYQKARGTSAICPKHMYKVLKESIENWKESITGTQNARELLKITKFRRP